MNDQNFIKKIWGRALGKPNAERGSDSSPPTEQPRLPAPAPSQDAGDWMRRALDDLKEHGFKAAKDSDEISQNPTRRAVLHEYAAGVIRSRYKGPFDPINNPEDAAVQETIEAVKARERKLENDHIRAAAARNETQRSVPADETPPRPSLPVMATAIIGFGLAFGTSINELPPLKAMEDDGMALIISFLIGVALGCLCVCSMFGLKVHEETMSAAWSPTPENPAWQMIAGLVMILAFALIRTYAATGPRDWLITAGLSAVDVGVLMYAKGEAARHRAREKAWEQRCDARHHKLLQADVAEKQCAAIELELEKARAERGSALAKLEARMRLNFDLEGMTQAAISAIDEGYFLGIDKNNGRYAAGEDIAA